MTSPNLPAAATQKDRHVDVRGGSRKPAEDCQDGYKKLECAAPSWLIFDRFKGLQKKFASMILFIMFFGGS
jgi:hypothetical protein